ncbi:zinc ribbon domain-containing protein [Lactiplantibacillus songbeiensis]|uniref:Zinc ribbon domain-containing protein n=1 Tax=Lactiplantibacillus songbeiensis TaxID=2559920 RepID=A0ABW4C1S2_9LACO|nr:zinc ribbon domain-containing protein [Lactiplantibacillus songbeiensis]
MEETKFCPHCGTKVGATVKFCPKCGFKLTSDEATSKPQATTATEETTKTATTRTTANTTNQSTGSGSDFNARLDAMMKWITANWATTVVIVVGIFVFSFLMRVLFYHASLGWIAVIAAVVWLYSYAWTNGVEPTSMEQQLRHVTKSGVDAVKTSTQAHADATTTQAQPTASQATTDPIQDTTQATGSNNIYVQAAPQSNGMGTAGFILALLSFLFSWIPGVSFVVWFLGMLFSFIGMFKRPRGLAITGFILSFIDLIVIFVILSVGIGILSSL